MLAVGVFYQKIPRMQSPKSRSTGGVALDGYLDYFHLVCLFLYFGVKMQRFYAGYRAIIYVDTPISDVHYLILTNGKNACKL